MMKDIRQQLDIINRAIDWADTYNKDTFPREELREYRRQIKKIAGALEENCSAAAYGESQVGKSYLMSSLLSTPDKPFVITNKGDEYNFIDNINPSGGNTSKTESTGVVTRFTVNNDNEKMKDFVRVKNLSVADIIMLLADSYYNDLKINPDSILRYDDINARLNSLNVKSDIQQNYLTEDDVKDICDYISDTLGSNAAGIAQSDFRKIVSSHIQYVMPDQWVNIFSLIWNNNPEISRLFAFLINEYRKLDFQTEVYVPFDAVLREHGTLLKIEWLEYLNAPVTTNTTDIYDTDVYDKDGNLLATSFSKSSLSALIAELTFILPQSITENRTFLKRIDLLDFPGARSREKFKEQDIKKVLSSIFRRGKVAYLFNKYSNSLRISCVLFCHHNDQKNEPTLGDTINEWIEHNIGKTPEERSECLMRTNGVSPLFFIATKFNIELERNKLDTPTNRETLEEHWKRFKTVIPEIIKPATWFEKWVKPSGIFRSEAFQSIYLLRDFYWSSKNQVFDGYIENSSLETGIHQFPDYPDYFDNLRDSFVRNGFVQRHFQNPAQAWESVASINCDGSKAIIRDLDNISWNLDNARKERYQKELNKIKEDILSKLQAYYEPEDKEQNNKRVRTIIGEIRHQLDMNIGTRPEIFGNIIDRLMIPVEDIRKIAYDIVVLKTKTPKDFNEIILIRTMAGVDLKDGRETNIKRLCDYYVCDANILEEEYKKKGFTIDDIVTNECSIAATVADVVSKEILEYWATFINKQVKEISQYLPYSDEIARMLQMLCKRLGVEKIISKKIDIYSRVFPETDLPNAIADFSSLTLNNFVSSVGREYMNANDMQMVSVKADTCHIQVETSTEYVNKEYQKTTLIEALKAFDDASDPTTVPINVLMKLPFWDNYQRWKNFLAIGLLYSADVSKQNPKANAAMKEIIIECESLYNHN